MGLYNKIINKLTTFNNWKINTFDILKKRFSSSINPNGIPENVDDLKLTIDGTGLTELEANSKVLSNILKKDFESFYVFNHPGYNNTVDEHLLSTSFPPTYKRPRQFNLFIDRSNNFTNTIFYPRRFHCTTAVVSGNSSYRDMVNNSSLENKIPYIGEEIKLDNRNDNGDSNPFFHPYLSKSGYQYKYPSVVKFPQLSYYNIMNNFLNYNSDTGSLEINFPETITYNQYKKYGEIHKDSKVLDNSTVSINYSHPDHIRYFLLVNESSTWFFNKTGTPIFNNMPSGFMEGDFILRDIEQKSTSDNCISIGMVMGTTLADISLPPVNKRVMDQINPDLINESKADAISRVSAIESAKLSLAYRNRVNFISIQNLKNLTHNKYNIYPFSFFTTINEMDSNFIYMGNTLLEYITYLKVRNNSQMLNMYRVHGIPILTQCPYDTNSREYAHGRADNDSKPRSQCFGNMFINGYYNGYYTYDITDGVNDPIPDRPKALSLHDLLERVRNDFNQSISNNTIKKSYVDIFDKLLLIGHTIKSSKNLIVTDGNKPLSATFDDNNGSREMFLSYPYMDGNMMNDYWFNVPNRWQEVNSFSRASFAVWHDFSGTPIDRFDYTKTVAPTILSLVDPTPNSFPFVDKNFKVDIDHISLPDHYSLNHLDNATIHSNGLIKFKMNIEGYTYDDIQNIEKKAVDYHMNNRNGSTWESRLFRNVNKYKSTSDPVDIWLLSMCNWVVYKEKLVEAVEDDKYFYNIENFDNRLANLSDKAPCSTIVRPSFIDITSIHDIYNSNNEILINKQFTRSVFHNDYNGFFLEVGLGNIFPNNSKSNFTNKIMELAHRVFNNASFLGEPGVSEVVNLPHDNHVSKEYKKYKLRELLIRLYKKHIVDQFSVKLEENGSLKILCYVNQAGLFQTEYEDENGIPNPLYYCDIDKNSNTRFDSIRKEEPFFDDINGIWRINNTMDEVRKREEPILIHTQKIKIKKPNPEFVTEKAKIYFEEHIAPTMEGDGNIWEYYSEWNPELYYIENGVRVSNILEEIEIPIMNQYIFSAYCPVVTHPDYIFDNWFLNGKGCWGKLKDDSFSKMIKPQSTSTIDDKMLVPQKGEVMVGFMFEITPFGLGYYLMGDMYELGSYFGEIC